MTANILFCTLVFLLGSHVTADLFHKAVKETQQIVLHCHPPVEDKVTWSMERNGSMLDIITTHGDQTIRHIKGTSKLYGLQVDKAMTILKAEISDSGKYFCNNKSAVNLTVFPSGTKVQNVKEGRNTSLNCSIIPERSQPTWRREVAGKSEPIRSPVPAVGKRLKITNVQLSDFGLYYCGEKPVVYLNVTKVKKRDGDKDTTMVNASETVTTVAQTFSSTVSLTETKATKRTATQRTPPPTATIASTLTTTQTAYTPPGMTNADPMYVGLGAGIGVLILMIIIYFIWRYRLKKQGANKQYQIYDEILDTTELQPARGGSNQEDSVYSTIPDLPLSETNLRTPTTNNPYSLADHKVCPGNNKARLGI